MPITTPEDNLSQASGRIAGTVEANPKASETKRSAQARVTATGRTATSIRRALEPKPASEVMERKCPLSSEASYCFGILARSTTWVQRLVSEA